MSEQSKAISAKMAQAAETARQTYPKGGTALQAAEWMQKNYISAGYKNLSKIMLQEEGIRPIQSLLKD